MWPQYAKLKDGESYMGRYKLQHFGLGRDLQSALFPSVLLIPECFKVVYCNLSKQMLLKHLVWNIYCLLLWFFPADA